MCRFIHSRLRLKTLHIDLNKLERNIFGISLELQPPKVVSVEPRSTQDCLGRQWARDLLQIDNLERLLVGFSGKVRIGMQIALAWLLMITVMRHEPGLSREECAESWLSRAEWWIWPKGLSHF